MNFCIFFLFPGSNSSAKFCQYWLFLLGNKRLPRIIEQGENGTGVLSTDDVDLTMKKTRLWDVFLLSNNIYTISVALTFYINGS